MYESFFGLKESPFSIAPDPRYLYMSERHKEALAHLLYGLEREGGFVLLTGEVGTGKTTICRRFIHSVPENTELAFILYPKLTARELLATICDEFGIDYPLQSTTKILIDLIYEHLLDSHATGKHTALIIDEAQNLSIDVLEQLRLLTNLETDRKKLLQIILLGQPELQQILQKQELRQLSQRVTARYHLAELSFDDFCSYISFRLNVAGCPRPIFSRSALKQIYKGSRGIPRLVNLICDRALLGAYASHSSEVSGSIVKEAIREIGHETNAGRLPWWDNWVFKGILSGILAATVTLAIAYVIAPDREFKGINSASVTEPVVASPKQAETIDAVSADVKGDEPIAGTLMEAGLSTDASPGVKAAESNPGPPGAGAAKELSPLAVLDIFAEREGGVSQAYVAIYRLWKVSPDLSLVTEHEQCNWAELQGLRCLHREGNWRSLIQLNRPVVLKMMTPSGTQFALPLLDVDQNEIATVQLGGERHNMTLSDLDQYWRGEYSLLWRPPPYESQVIQPGAIQDKDTWLTRQLDILDEVLGISNQAAEAGHLAEPAGDLFLSGQGLEPRPLKDRVREFQQRVGILPDGIAGTITVIMLNSWTNPDVPLLKSAKNS